MKRWTLEHIARITGGTLHPPTASLTVGGISTNSRSLEPGQLFIPLRGENFDGHDFLMEAARQGAAACLSEELIHGFAVPVIKIKNSLRALGDLGAASRFESPVPLVALTGSAGKTTTKEMLASILSTTGAGLKTAGNFNNLIGVPLTLLRLEEHHRWAVIEMGMNRPGEISALTRMSAPSVGLITNVGASHLEGVGDMEGVARAKGELFAGLAPGSTAVVNLDDERVKALPLAAGVRSFSYGLDPEADLGAENLLADAGTGLGACYRFVLRLGERRYPVRLNVAGRHNVHNAMAAAAAATVLGVSMENIVHGALAARCADRLYLLGQSSQHTALGAREQGMAQSAIEHLDSSEEIVRRLKKPLKNGGTVLVKGSRGMRMERICEALRGLFGLGSNEEKS